jgi:two-component system sensor histidine kinase DesK
MTPASAPVAASGSAPASDGHGSDTVAVVERPSQAVRPRFRYAWAWGGIWLVYLVQPLNIAWQTPDPVRRWIAITALGAFAACFLASFTKMRSVRTGGNRTVLTGAILTATAAALVVTVTFVLDKHSIGLFIYVGVMAMFLLPGRWGPIIVGMLIVATLVAQWLSAGWKADYTFEFQIFVSSMAMWGITQIILRNRELAAAREEITRLAVADERNRFSRDLHDILGHSLTVVAVKAELAGRLVRADPARAEAEISDVEQLSRQALAEVRTAVAGYRDVTLASELVNARSALSAAGIDADLPTAIDDVPPAHRELFGWVVREGVTNVVRHSRASRCRVRIAPSEVEVADNGPPAAGAATAPEHAPPTGHGLAGLRERAEAGRRHVVGPAGSRGRLCVDGDGMTVRV